MIAVGLSLFIESADYFIDLIYMVFLDLGGSKGQRVPYAVQIVNPLQANL